MSSKVGLIAVHHPRPGDRGEFIARVELAAAAMRPTPGCLSAECWLDVAGDAVISTALWESEQARRASLAAARAAGVDFAYDERESRPREIIRLVAP